MQLIGELGYSAVYITKNSEFMGNWHVQSEMNEMYDELGGSCALCAATEL